MFGDNKVYFRSFRVYLLIAAENNCFTISGYFSLLQILLYKNYQILDTLALLFNEGLQLIFSRFFMRWRKFDRWVSELLTWSTFLCRICLFRQFYKVVSNNVWFSLSSIATVSISCFNHWRFSRPGICAFMDLYLAFLWTPKILRLE